MEEIEGRTAYVLFLWHIPRALSHTTYAQGGAQEKKFLTRQHSFVLPTQQVIFFHTNVVWKSNHTAL